MQSYIQQPGQAFVVTGAQDQLLDSLKGIPMLTLGILNQGVMPGALVAPAADNPVCGDILFLPFNGNWSYNMVPGQQDPTAYLPVVPESPVRSMYDDGQFTMGEFYPPYFQPQGTVQPVVPGPQPISMPFQPDWNWQPEFCIEEGEIFYISNTNFPEYAQYTSQPGQPILAFLALESLPNGVVGVPAHGCGVSRSPVFFPYSGNDFEIQPPGEYGPFPNAISPNMRIITPYGCPGSAMQTSVFGRPQYSYMTVQDFYPAYCGCSYVEEEVVYVDAFGLALDLAFAPVYDPYWDCYCYW